jgi:hypothetical protein
VLFHFLQEFVKKRCSIEKLFGVVDLFVVFLYVGSVLIQEAFLLFDRVKGDEGSDCQNGKNCE